MEVLTSRSKGGHHGFVLDDDVADSGRSRGRVLLLNHDNHVQRLGHLWVSLTRRHQRGDARYCYICLGCETLCPSVQNICKPEDNCVAKLTHHCRPLVRSLLAQDHSVTFRTLASHLALGAGNLWRFDSTYSTASFDVCPAQISGSRISDIDSIQEASSEWSGCWLMSSFGEGRDLEGATVRVIAPG